MPEYEASEETQWSLVLRARSDDSTVARTALSHLCNRYWFPVYAYILKTGKSPEHARDLTQDFFLRIIEGRVLDSADPKRGKFRSLLFSSVRNFLTDAWRHDQAARRGGATSTLSLDFEHADALYASAIREEDTPDRAFDRQWARTVMAHAFMRLQRDYKKQGKADVFLALQGVLTQESGSVDYEVVATTLRVSENAARTAAHRLRKRYADALRTEVSQTVSELEHVGDEVKYLLDALR